MRENKGFSLVELIVAFAIFAIVGVAICSFISFSSKSFANSGKESKIQYEQQLAVNNIRDVILETSRAVNFNSTTKSLIIFSDEPDKSVDEGGNRVKPPYLVSEIYFVEEEHRLYYRSVNLDQIDSIESIPWGGSAGGIIADLVTDFNVDLDKLADGEVIVDVTFEVGNKKSVSHSVVSLRNKIVVADDSNIGKLYEEKIEFSSVVKSIAIKRDDKIFKQGETDTITVLDNKSNGSITGAARYSAVVTGKKYYDENISQGATWKLDAEYKDKAGNTVISVSPGGIVSFNGKYNADGSSTIDEAIAATDKDYIVLVAASIVDPSKTARIKIKPTQDGIYPVSIESKVISELDDTLYGQKQYTLEHTITYEGFDPITKVKDPVISGEEAYKRVRYSVTEGDAAAELPAGAGFAENSKDGIFVATKSMEGHTYKIRITVIGSNRDGEEVYTEVTITVNNIPSKEDTPVPVLGAPETADRGAACSIGVAWSGGAPTYTENGEKKSYYYRFKMEVDNADNQCGNWGTSELNNFNYLVYWSSYEALNNRKTVYGTQVKRMQNLWIESKLNWKQTYTIRVTVTPYIAKKSDFSDEQPYMYKDSKVITIKPVELRLTADEVTLYKNNKQQDGALPGVFFDTGVLNRGDYVGPQSYKTWYEQEKNNHDYEYTYTEWTSAKWQTRRGKTGWFEYHTSYWKIFDTEFSGLSVTPLNYTSNVSGVRNRIDTTGDGKEDSYAFTIYYYDEKTKQNKPYNYSTGTSSDIRVANYNVYVALHIRPEYWLNKNKYPTWPSEAQYRCVVYDQHGNSVTAKFVEGDSEPTFTRYKIDIKK